MKECGTNHRYAIGRENASPIFETEPSSHEDGFSALRVVSVLPISDPARRRSRMGIGQELRQRKEAAHARLATTLGEDNLARRVEGSRARTDLGEDGRARMECRARMG